MKDSRIRYVVDASVGIKLFVIEEFSDQAHALFSHLAGDPPAELYVPDLFYIECSNILLKYSRRFGRSLAIGRASFTPEQLRDNLGALLDALNKSRPASSKGIFLKKVSVSSTMGLGVKVDPATLSAQAQ